MVDNDGSSGIRQFTIARLGGAVALFCFGLVYVRAGLVRDPQNDPADAMIFLGTAALFVGSMAFYLGLGLLFNDRIRWAIMSVIMAIVLYIAAAPSLHMFFD
jgi:hypothetical protein